MWQKSRRLCWLPEKGVMKTQSFIVSLNITIMELNLFVYFIYTDDELIIPLSHNAKIDSFKFLQRLKVIQ